MATDLTAGIVRILRPNGTSAGSGFLVSEDGLIITCTHVLQDCSLQKRGEPQPERVSIVFQAIGEERREATVEPNLWRGCEAGDIAVLRLEGSVPNGVNPLLLGASAGTSGHAFKTFGFPEAKPDAGLYGYGTIGDTNTDEIGQMILQLTGATEVTPGFSGAPVLDTITDRIVGMVTTITRPDSYGRLAETAFITPTEMLRSVCPALQLSDVRPYRSLDAFTETDAAFFFGRQRVVDRLLDGLRREPRFLAVLGPSGSGKSSLVQAGLIPQLRQGIVPGSDHWGIIVTRPANQPFEQLTVQGLVGALEDLAEAAKVWLAQHTSQTRLVLVIDQFEELLVTCPEPLRQTFAMQLTKMLNSALPITVILTMRDDFYSRFAQQTPQLLPWLERALINTPPTLEMDELTAIVQEPAKAVGLKFESGLAQAIIGDAVEASTTLQDTTVTGRSTVLPLLEFALTQLWERRQDGMLSRQAYHAIGKVTGSLTQWADQAFYAFDERIRSLVRRVFTDLVHIGDESQGLPDSRQRRALTALHRSESEPWRVDQIVQQLTDKRLLVTSRDAHNNQETVEIIHDALIREWRQLQQWLQEDRRFLLWRQEIEGRALAWAKTDFNNAAQRDEGKLLRGRDLAEAEGWLHERPADLGQLEQEFIRTGLALRERERIAQERLRQRIIQGLAAGFVVAVLLALLAFSQFLVAKTESENRATQQHIAVNNASTALAAQATSDRRSGENQSLALAANANVALSNGDLDLANVLALNANNFPAPPEQSQRILAQLAYLPGAHRQFEGQLNGIVTAITFSPDGNSVLAGSSGGTLALWNAETGQVIQRFGEENINNIISSIAFSTDGHSAFSATEAGQLSAWNIDTGKLIQQFRFASTVNETALSEDGNLFVFDQFNNVTGPTSDYALVVWNTATGKEIKHFVIGKSGQVHQIRISRDKHMIICFISDPRGNNNSAVIFWDLDSSKQMQYLDLGSGQSSAQGSGRISISSDSNTALIAFGSPATLIIWDLKANKELFRRNTSYNNIVSSAFSPEGQIALMRIADNSLVWWDVRTGKEVFHFKGNVILFGQGLVFGTDGKSIISGTTNGTLQLWDAGSGFELHRFDNHSVTRYAELTANSQTMIASSDDGHIRLWDTKTDHILWDIKPYSQVPILAAAALVTLSPDGRSALIDYPANDLIIVDVKTGKKIERIENYDRLIFPAAFSPDGHLIANFSVGLGSASSSPGQLMLWDIITNRKVLTFQPSPVATGIETISQLAFSPDGSLLASAGFAQNSVASGVPELILYNTSTGQVVRQFKFVSGFVSTVVFSPDGRTLLSGSSDGEIILWNVNTGAEIRRLQGHSGAVLSVATSPDGRQVLSGDADGKLILWDFETGAEILRFQGHIGAVHSVMFAHDGRSAISSSDDGTIRLWQISYTLAELANWIQTNRMVRDLTCFERTRYNVQPFCSVGTNLPTSTPYPTLTASPTLTSYPTTTPTTISTAQSAITTENFEYSLIDSATSQSEDWGGQLWAFPGHVGDVVNIAMNSSNFDSYLVLKGPDGKILTADDDGGDGLNALIDHYRLLTSGEYFVIARKALGGIASSNVNPSQYKLTVTLFSHQPSQLPFKLRKLQRATLGIGFITSMNGKILIDKITSGTAGDMAGVKAGDVLVAVNGQTNFSSVMDVLDLIRIPIGSRLTMTLERNGKTFDVEINFGDSLTGTSVLTPTSWPTLGFQLRPSPTLMRIGRTATPTPTATAQ